MQIAVSAEGTKAGVDEMWIDLRYADVEAELWALEESLKSLEPTIDRLGQLYEDRTFAELAEKGLADDEAERSFAWQSVDDLRNFVLPYQFRNGFLVMLWSGFELCLGAVGTELARRVGKPGRSPHSFTPPLTKTRATFRRLGVELEPDPDRFARLSDLYDFRSAIVHSGARKDAVPPERWKALVGFAARHDVRVERWRDALLAQPAYPPLAFADVADTLRGVVERAKAAEPPRVARQTYVSDRPGPSRPRR